MLARLIELSLSNRLLTLALVGLMALMGVASALNLPIDAVPDMTNTQVQIVTDCGSLSPLEVEQYVTFPVESVMSGLPRLQELRSVSKFGISLVTVVFEEGTDLYRARQAVAERLPEAARNIPAGYGVPELGPMATALGEILQFEVRSDHLSPMELRTILEWDIVPRLRQVAGVTAVNTHGGFYRAYEVRPDPDRMQTAGVSLEDIFHAIERNHATAGGGYVVHHGEQRFLRGEALLRHEYDLLHVQLKQTAGTPILLGDVAQVVIAPLTRQGAASRDGRGEAVTGMVMMLLGANSRVVVHAARERIEEINHTLPPGVWIEIIYDRAELIERTLHTVEKNLLEGGILVIVVLLVMLENLRAGLIVALAIPLSMLFAANVMQALGISANLMSLGAIDFGLIVDSSLIMVENCVRRLGMNHGRLPHAQVIRDAALEVRKPTMFGELIITVVYIPILALQGTEGKLFRPMALTVLFALTGSLVLSLTFMPAMASLCLPTQMVEKESHLMRLVHRVFDPWVRLSVRHPVLTAIVALAIFSSGLPLAWSLGAEFMPRLDEGDLLIECVRLPSATLEDTDRLTRQIETLLLSFPEVKTVFCKTGRPEIANDVMGVHQTDVWVMLKPVDQWPQRKSRDELIGEMSQVLQRHVPGAIFGFTQPIEMRVDELVAGVKADVAVLVYGDNLKTLATLGKQIEAVLSSVPGAADVKAEHQADLPTLRIQARPEAMARYGIEGAQVMDAVAALGGRQVGQIFEGRKRFPIVVRIPESWRSDASRLAQIPIFNQQGVPIPLDAVADLIEEESPPSIEHEATRRRTYVQCNVRGRDVASFVYEAQKKIAESVKLPAHYELRWGGDFENLQTASQRLALLTPVVLLMIFMLLHTTFRSVRLALLIFLAVPIAATGGVWALWLRGMPFSISAGVGFIALFGVAVLNGLVWVSHAEHLRHAGYDSREAAAETARARLRPVLMTASVASLGFVPMALATTTGAEIQRPLATVVIGGLITATLMTTLVVPAIYPWFVRGMSASRLEASSSHMP
ncbi:MAG: cation transporter [Planctomycetaceae bacterium]|nr:MAG: cation transporter [Planctomycetaceae bacterium]